MYDSNTQQCYRQFRDSSVALGDDCDHRQRKAGMEVREKKIQETRDMRGK